MRPENTTLPPTAVCEYCGSSFTIRWRGNPNRFCSRSCARRVQSPRPWKPGQGRADNRHTCSYCGRAFVARPAMRPHARTFCSRDCYTAARQPQRAGKRACSRCGVVKPPEAFGTRGATYRLTYCKDCHNARIREKYATDAGYAQRRKENAVHKRRDDPHEAARKRAWAQEHPEHVRAAVERSRQRYPERAAARRAAREAVKQGHLVPQPCWCGEATVEMHHHSGYDRAHWLDVTWLCRKHHRELHRRY